MEIAGDFTISSPSDEPGGIILLLGSAQTNQIVSDGKPATLALVNQTLKGAGTIGDTNLTLNNASGTIDADVAALLTINTGTNIISNSGTLFADGGKLTVLSPVDNTGTFDVDADGELDLEAPVSGPGAIDIGPAGTAFTTATIAGNITFTSASGKLEIGNTASNGGIGGEIAGGQSGDTILLETVAYSSSIQAVWEQVSANAGTLSIVSGGSTVFTLNLAGQYANGEFGVQNESGEVLVVLPNPGPPSGTTGAMIMRDGGNGDYEIYDLGNNTIQAAYALGQVGTAWLVAGVGGFFGTDTYDMILRNSATGAFEIYDISNNNITNATSMGAVGLDWSVAGFGDFSTRPNETDMLMRNTNAGAFEIYDLANNGITFAAPMGQVDLEWSAVGFGDFSGHVNETDMLMRNTNTGAFEIYDISNNQLTSFVSMGAVGLEWSVAGFGDFSGNPNETDMLMRNANTGAFEIYDITNNQLTSFASMGAVGLDWQVVGFGPINGAGSSDMLMRNSNSGVFELYDITNNTLGSFAAMGAVGLDWSVGGIAADPPGGSSPAQLAQAMASYAPNDSAVATATAPNLPTTQSILPNSLAAANSQNPLPG